MPGVIAGYEIEAGSQTTSTAFRQAFEINGSRYRGQHGNSSNAWDLAFMEQFEPRTQAEGFDLAGFRFHDITEITWYGSGLVNAGDLDGDHRANDLFVISSIGAGVFAHIDLRAHTLIADDRSIVTYPTPFRANGTTLGFNSAVLGPRRFAQSAFGRVEIFSIRQ